MTPSLTRHVTFPFKCILQTFIYCYPIPQFLTLTCTRVNLSFSPLNDPRINLQPDLRWGAAYMYAFNPLLPPPPTPLPPMTQELHILTAWFGGSPQPSHCYWLGVWPWLPLGWRCTGVSPASPRRWYSRGLAVTPPEPALAGFWWGIQWSLWTGQQWTEPTSTIFTAVIDKNN